MNLNVQPRPDAVASPWRGKNQEPYSSVLSMPTIMLIREAYEQADGELLILGEPGAGKTTLMLELTRELVERCRMDEAFPIPVVFNLSSWAERRASLTDWLAEELNLRYQVPVKIASQWVANDQVCALLDGLDEVDLLARPACVEAINAYRQEHGFLPMVICCRSLDYDSLPEHLILNMAVEMQPLTVPQIDAYVSGDPHLGTVRVALQNDPGLQEIVSTPLMLNILSTLAYSAQEEGMSQGAAVHVLYESRHSVLEQYVDRLLVRETKKHPYTKAQMKQWLSWLAWQMAQHNQTEFYIERIQPDWLENKRAIHQYQRTVVRLIMLVQCLICGGLTAWLKGGLKNGIVGSGNGILGEFGGGVGNTMMGWMSPGIGGGSQGGASLIIILGIVIWLVTILVGSPTLPSLIP